MYVINQQTRDNNILTLHDVFKIYQNTGGLRLVKTEENEKYISIIICGVFRIRKNKKNNKITLWGYKLRDKHTGYGPEEIHFLVRFFYSGLKNLHTTWTTG